MGKQTKFMRNLTADNKSIKHGRAVLEETSLITEIEAKTTVLKREKLEIERQIDTLMDMAPTTTQALSFGDGLTPQKRIEMLHDLKMKLKMEIQPSIDVFEDIMEEHFTEIE